MKRMDPRKLLRNLLIEVVIYSFLIVAYYLLVLHSIGGWLAAIFGSNLYQYAFIGLGLILAQAVILDIVTSLMMKYIKLDQFGIRRILDVFSNR